MSQPIVKNTVENSNPYGSVTYEEVLAFEARNGLNLPEDYRQYLVQHNGGNFVRRIFISKCDSDVDGSVHGIKGLHQGPEYVRLQDDFHLSDLHDLADFAQELLPYFVFSGTDGANSLIIDMETSKVCVFLADVFDEETLERLNACICPVADSFTEFVDSLVDQDTFIALMTQMLNED